MYHPNFQKCRVFTWINFFGVVLKTQKPSQNREWHKCTSRGSVLFSFPLLSSPSAMELSLSLMLHANDDDFQSVYFRQNKYNHGQTQDTQQNRLKSEHRMAVCTQAYTTSLGRLPFNVFTSVRENPSGKKTKDFPGKFLLPKMSHLFFFFYTTVTLSTEERNFYKGMTMNE